MRLILTVLLTASALLGAVACDEITVDQKKDQDSKPAAESKPSDPAIIALDKFIAESKIDKSRPGWKTSLPKPPKQTFDAKKSYFWNLETTKGTIKIKLLADVAPMHVSSTIYLTRLGFYDDIKFHRIIKNFMAQGGCPNGDGRGSPGYKYDGEFSPAVRHTKRGTLSMANAGPGTDGSQFFLTFVPTQFLDGKHTVFGEVVDGEATMAAMEAAGADRDPAPPKELIKITKATITVE
jgi:peptidyl-prolyl cis-trans isomerase B (cyclophilin B)